MADLTQVEIVTQVAELAQKVMTQIEGANSVIAIGALCNCMVNINLSTSNTTEELHAAFKRDIEFLTALFGANFDIPEKE